jgi:hypothetical protein
VLDHLESGREIGLGLPRKADDDIGGQGDVGAGGGLPSTLSRCLSKKSLSGR